MKVTVFIGEVVWEPGEANAPSAERLSGMVTASLEQQLAGTETGPRVPQGRSSLTGLVVNANQPVDSVDALGRSIATAVHHSLDQGNW